MISNYFFSGRQHILDLFYAYQIKQQTPPQLLLAAAMCINHPSASRVIMTRPEYSTLIWC